MADGVLLFVTYKPKEVALAELRELFRSRTIQPLDLDVAARMLRKHLGLSYEPRCGGCPAMTSCWHSTVSNRLRP